MRRRIAKQSLLLAMMQSSGLTLTSLLIKKSLNTSRKSWKRSVRQSFQRCTALQVPAEFQVHQALEHQGLVEPLVQPLKRSINSAFIIRFMYNCVLLPYDCELIFLCTYFFAWYITKSTVK